MSEFPTLEFWLSSQVSTTTRHEGPQAWTDRYIANAYTKNESDYTFVSEPLSPQSVILHAATTTELANYGYISEKLGSEILRLSNADRHVDQLFRWLIIDAATRGHALPHSLRGSIEYVANGGQPPKKKGERGWKLLNRDLIGSSALLVLTAENCFSLKPTRNRATAGVCACDILSQATTGSGWAFITFDAAEGIWRNRDRHWMAWDRLLTLSWAKSMKFNLLTDTALAWIADFDALGSG